MNGTNLRDAAVALNHARDLFLAKGAALPAYLEPLLLIRDVDNPQIALEPAFARYVRLWVSSASLDATSHGLHCLRVASTPPTWLSRNGSAIRLYLSRCLRESGFSIAPDKPSPSLYATVNGLNCLKALVGCDEGTPFFEKRDEIRAIIGDGLLEQICRGSANLLREHHRDGGFVDCRDDTTPTTHALYFAILLLWNLQLLNQAADFALSEAEASEFVMRCRECLDGNGVFGFIANPPVRRFSNGHPKPCTTTTAMVLMGFNRAGWQLPFELEPVLAFFERMEVDGGFCVFPGEQVTLSATAFSVVALDHFGWLDGRFQKDKIIRFINDCRRGNGGFAFSPHPQFSANIHCTRYGLRALAHLDPTRALLASEACGITRYVDDLFDAHEGAIWGYGRVAEAELPKVAVNSEGTEDSVLGHERLLFEAERPRLLAEARGKYALACGTELKVFEHEREAICAGYAAYGRTPFLVEEIGDGENRLRVSRCL